MLNFLRRLILGPAIVAALLLSGAWWVHAQTGGYGPYRVISFNHTDRSIYSFQVDDFGAGGSYAHESQGGGGIVCCMDVPRGKKTWHIKIIYDLTKDEAQKNVPNEVYETDIPVPPLPNKHGGYIAFHFLPDRKIEAQWVERRIKANIPNAN
ncbi:DUF3304 domain-containing protein [Burkholderia sp. Bp8992]|uniref:DUF3304 domain-containing protein n=1 Tax=Burkholderia sp. Bp8992 TaxID=2184554 RepID=UPI000F586CA9|nr:DUF3304 domain-containing protein [Burkholderia sp. Bp8992]RQS19239.1 DUF3304 domain-containing protein [Burkholderia sp. Bp8992]